MMISVHRSGKIVAGARRVIALIMLVNSAARAAQQSSPPQVESQARVYWFYVGAESADLIHRLRFRADTTVDARLVVEKTTRVGQRYTEVEGPHGLAVSPDGRSLYVTTAHGEPNGRLWHYQLGPDTLADVLFLGRYPASVDVTPDGRYAVAANLNLYDGMAPSSLSVVSTQTNTQVAQIPTCAMPHGSRVSPDGQFHYSVCMMDDQLVEVDTRHWAVSRRFALGIGNEGSLATDSGGHVHTEQGHEMAPTCSPTWAQPSADGKTIFVACNKADVIVAIDRDHWVITQRLKTGRGPYNLAVTPDGKLLVATLKREAQVEIFDLDSARSVARLPTSTTLPHGVAVSIDSHYAFVTSEGVGSAPGKVDVYDLQARAAVGSANVGQQASGVAFWKMAPASR